MTIITDDKRRVTLPPPARPRLVRRRGLKLIAGVPVSARQIAADLNRARDERAQDLP